MKPYTDQQRKEEWRDIPGYEGLYAISSLGHIKNLKRDKCLKPQMSGTGYWKVCLWKNSFQKNHNLHRLMAESFIPNPQELPQVNHKNGIKKDCHLENLEWCTASQNGKHAYRVLGVVPHMRGKHGKSHPLSKGVIQKTKEGITVKVWESMKQTEEMGFDNSCVSRCCTGQYKSHKGFVWEYETTN